MNLSSGVLTVSKVKRKNNRIGFKDLKVGDQIEIFIDLNGGAGYHSAPQLTIFNYASGDKTVKYLSQVSKDIKDFEFEGFNKLEEDKE